MMFCRWNLWCGVAFSAALGCQSQPATPEEPGPDCEPRKARLQQLLQQLPEQAWSVPLKVNLAAAGLGGSLGQGSILEVSESWVALDGVPVEGATRVERLEQLRQRLVALAANRQAAPPAPQPSAAPTALASAESGAAPAVSAASVLYVAASPDTDVRTMQAYLQVIPDGILPKLLFGARPLPEDRTLSGHDLAARVFAERDPLKRQSLAKQGYAEYSQCGATAQALDSVQGQAPEQRWPNLRRAMLAALPQCQCEQVDAENLGYLLVAEQRAGGVAIGSLPIDFLEDERCSAAMPLRSVQQVLEDIEKFEEEFSGEWQKDALHFEEVLTSERLLTYLCQALPGETLASLQRARRTLYFRTEAACQAWQFEPLSPGAPMGTWRRSAGNGLSELAVHYRQYAEDLRVYGPVTSTESNPTDEGPWECSQDFHLAEVDDRSIRLESGGRWFFNEAACRAAPLADSTFTGCVADLLSRP